MSTEISRYLSNQYEESNHCGKDNNDYKHYGNMQESLDVVHQDSPPVPHGKIQRWTLYMHTPYAVKTCFPKGFTKPAAPPSFISWACALDLSNRDWKSAPPCSQAMLMADFMLSVTTMNFDGLSSLWLRNVTTYVLAMARGK